MVRTVILRGKSQRSFLQSEEVQAAAERKENYRNGLVDLLLSRPDVTCGNTAYQAGVRQGSKWLTFATDEREVASLF
jgi:hypothetical protein